VEGDERDRFRSLALNDLRTSISLSAENAIDAATDSDFNPIRNLDEFKLLVRS